LMEHHIDLELVGPIAAKTNIYQERKTCVMEIIEACLRDVDTFYVALSGGKDSVALLGLVADVAGKMGKDVLAWAHLSDASFPGTVETCRAACAVVGCELMEDWSPVSAWDVIGQQSSQRFGKTGFFFDAVRRMNRKYDLVFTGVRAAESLRRLRAARARGPVFPSGQGKAIRCDAIQRFTIEDVAAAIFEYRMPVHPIYRKMAVGERPIRLGYATSLDLIDDGTVVFMRRNYPHLYRRLVAALPHTRNLA